MKKKVIIAIVVIINVLIAVIIGIMAFRHNDVENAIEDFEDGDYADAIVQFNKLIPLQDYESAEKLYYYRCRAINRLANRLEKDYDDELTDASMENRNTPKFDRAKKEITGELESVNKRIKGDLAFSLQKKKSRIVSGGAFYGEFLARYKGSALVEDLDFEEIQQIAKTDPAAHINALFNFYVKYPNTGYISQIVNTLMEGLQQNRISFKEEKKDTIWNIILSYARRYPTSSITSKLFTSKADNVNLRNSPGIQGARVGKLDKDDIVIQLEKSMDSSQVGDTRDYWYRVASLAGAKGWIFGKFLAPLDIASLNIDAPEEKWAFDERFDEWADSNTPKNWIHIAGADKQSIGFKEAGGKKIITIDSPKGKKAGLYSRYGAPRAFTVVVKAKFVAGQGVTLFGYSLGKDASYYVKLQDETVDVTGRTIPVHTSDWHEYELSSDDGKFAVFKIDDEVVSGRIKPVAVPDFGTRGIYCLVSGEKESSKAEIEFLKIK